MCKFETKNPLVNQHIINAVITKYGMTKKVIVLYKKGIGYSALTAKGSRLSSYLTDNRPLDKFKRLLHGIKEVRFDRINTSKSEYYTRLLGDLNEILQADEYWNGKADVQKMYKRVAQILSEISDEDIEVEIPELVAYFYNFNTPSSVRFLKELEI